MTDKSDNSTKDKGAAKKPQGRPSLYRIEYCPQVEEMCRNGATDQEIADALGVSQRTINNWRAVYPEFAAVMRIGKEVADDRVERSLYARAIGYEHDEVDLRVVNGQIVHTTIRKYYPPDANAATLWLANRRKDQWRLKVDHEHSGPEGKPIQHDVTLSPNEGYLKLIGK